MNIVIFAVAMSATAFSMLSDARKMKLQQKHPSSTKVQSSLHSPSTTTHNSLHSSSTTVQPSLHSSSTTVQSSLHSSSTTKQSSLHSTSTTIRTSSHSGMAEKYDSHQHLPAARSLGITVGNESTTIKTSSHSGTPEKYKSQRLVPAARNVGFTIGRCVDCANNQENYRDPELADPMKDCIREGKGLVCKAEGLTWACAETKETKARQCHKSYTYEIWCNSKVPGSTKCDGELTYKVEGGDGRIPGPNGTNVGPDGKYNWFDGKLSASESPFQ